MATAQINQTKLEIHFRSCRDAGMPRDQVELLTTAAYCPTPKQQEFHAAARKADTDGATLILYGGKRGGGKSHATVAQAGLDDCQRYPGLKVLFLRKLQRAAKESFNDLVSRALKGTTFDLRADKLIFPNGSFILLGGYRNSQDLEKYVGIEYDLIIIEELTQLREEDFQKIRGSLRTSRTDGWRPRMYLTTNPGDIGHEFVKLMFIIPYRQGTQRETVFIPSGANDNPHINPEYREYLDSLSGIWRAMWRDGDWDLQGGRAFPLFGEENIITLSEYMEMTARGNWVRYRGVDFGTASPFACVWIAVEPTFGRVIAYRQLYQAGLAAGQQADLIRQHSPENEVIAMSYCDPAMRIRQSTETELVSAIDMYASHGVYLAPGINDRVTGKMKLDNLLTTKPDGNPGFYIVQGECDHLIYTLENLQKDTKNPEDVMKCEFDHDYDALRYAYSGVRDYVLVEPSKHVPVRNPLMDLFPS
jgi:phage terminase large subunit